MKQVILRLNVIIRANRIDSVPADACNAEVRRAGRVFAAWRVQVSRIVTGKVSFKNCRDVLPIVRLPGNVYRAPHIHMET
jgi:hypothetical protein